MQDHSKDLAFTLSEMGSLHEQSWAMTWLETFSPVIVLRGTARRQGQKQGEAVRVPCSTAGERWWGLGSG